MCNGRIAFTQCRGIKDAGIEERLKVLAFPACDEHFGDVASTMKCEAPNTRVGADTVEHRCAWQGSIHDNKMRHCVPVALGIGIGYHETNVMTDHDGSLLDSEMLMKQ